MYKGSFFLLLLFLLIPSFLFSTISDNRSWIQEKDKDRAWLGVVVKDLSKSELRTLKKGISCGKYISSVYFFFCYPSG